MNLARNVVRGRAAVPAAAVAVPVPVPAPVPAPVPQPPTSMELPFLALDAELPLLLLPVRIDTRYRLHTDPAELCVRILPDQVHVATDSASPGTTETELTKQFWTAWHAAAGKPRQQAAWRRFARRVGAERAGHLARLLRPRLDGDNRLIFPILGGLSQHSPTGPQLLPQQWLAVGYRDGQAVFQRASLPVREGLRTGPDPAAPAWEAGNSGLRLDEGLDWLVDYDRAVAAGMAITIALTGDAAAAAEGLDTLIVVGVMSQIEAPLAAAGLDQLLRAHARSSGLAFVPQGTPTNNTEGVPSGWSPAEAELTELADRELEPPAPAQGTNAARLASALGLADDITLRRLAFGTDRERARSRAMVRVSFEALLGTMMRSLLRVGDTNGVRPATANAARAWCIEHVTGGAAYPCLRIGPQPYGLLPVRRSVTVAEPGNTAAHIEHVIALLAGQWQRAASYLPVLDHNRGEGGGGDTELAATNTATVLASQPHPARLFVRRLDNFADLSGLSEMLTPQWFYLNIILGGIDPATNPEIASPYVEIGRLYEAATANQEIDSVDTQISIWRSVSTGIRGYLESLGLGHHIDTAIDWIAAVISILTSYEQRQHPTRWLDLVTFAGVLGQTATTLVEGLMWQSSREWGPDGLAEAPDAQAGHTAAEYLTDLAVRFRQRDVEGMLPPTALTDDFIARQPLLYQLLDRTLHQVPRQEAEEQAVAEALELLATVPAADLDWLLRETLGLGMHRLDAWRTSLATERLQRLRRARPEGLQIGAFGWVQSLAPRKGPRRNAGYLHAPSLSQAATAAILRAGWQAHGSDDPLSPVAVDLRSARVRTASWLLDGIRAGQDLGDMLGYRFERALHDRHADDQIRSVRAAVLAASGQPDNPANSPVDGIALLDVARTVGLGPTPPAVDDAIADIEACFDAVNDAALAEAVHQLATGNYGRATAMLDALAGTHSPPELLAARTARDGISVEHRVLILLDPYTTAPPGRGWQPGLRDRLAPALDAWVCSLLPAAAAVALPDGLTLADLRLSALDAVYLVGDNPAELSAPLATLAAATTTGATGTTGTGSGGGGGGGGGGGADVPYADFAVTAIELRRAFESLRVADARDLRPAADPGESGLDTSAALEVAGEVIASFTAAVPYASPQELARFGVTVAEAPHRLEIVRAAKSVENQLAALFMARLPLLGRFTMPPTDFSVPVADPDEVDDWCDAMARVRPAVGRLFTAGMAAELAADGGGLRAVATQLPLVAGEPWVALHRPQTPRGNMSLVAVTGPGGPPAPGAPACALVVDQWAERIPHPQQVTGVAVQHDAPTNRPPQAWLLAVTPDEEKWSLQLVLDTLLETLDHAAQRAVGTEDLLDYGRAIPAVFVPGNIVNWPADAEEAS